MCARSQFFRAALNGKWKEGEENAVALPEDDPKIFSMYLELVYTGKIACKEGGVTILELQEDSDDDDGNEESEDDSNDEELESNPEDLSGSEEIVDVKTSPLVREWENVGDYKYFERTNEYAYLIELYILSDKLTDVVATNTIMEGFIEICEKHDWCFPSPSLISHAVENTPRDCGLQHWLQDLIIGQGNDCLSMIEEEELPKSFWCDLAREMAYPRRNFPTGNRRWTKAKFYRA